MLIFECEPMYEAVSVLLFTVSNFSADTSVEWMDFKLLFNRLLWHFAPSSKNVC